MQKIEDRTFDEERALYGSSQVEAVRCRFDGPADGESAFKERLEWLQGLRRAAQAKGGGEA